MTIAFTRVNDPYGWLSNMAPWTVDWDGVQWIRAEHAFQAMRFPKDCPMREAILHAANPMAAKFIAKANVSLMTVVPQSEEDVENMRLVVRLKIEQHLLLKKWLLATGDELIVEDCTRRQRGSGLFWGAARTGPPAAWKGDNMLGVIWMELRESLHPRGEA